MLFNLKKSDYSNYVNDQEAQGAPVNELQEKWFADDFAEGQLLVDVCQTEKNIIIKAPMAGVNPENLDISLNNDLLTIRGKREAEQEEEGADFLYKECYWGSFSRSLVLPAEVDSKKIKAFLENGVLTVVLTKLKAPQKVEVKIKE